MRVVRRAHLFGAAVVAVAAAFAVAAVHGSVGRRRDDFALRGRRWDGPVSAADRPVP
jgi:hypothetical protein